MRVNVNRRAFVAGLAASCAPIGARAEDPSRVAEQRIAELEARAGGRLGVCVIEAKSGEAKSGEAKSGRRLAHRAEEHFPMCSTFKALAAAAILARVDKGAEMLNRRIAYGPADLLDYAPVTKAHAAEGVMPLGDLCAAAIDWSDNTAANLMLQVIGGPAELTRYIRSIGDPVTRLDRNEPTLNTAIPGDERDTTTPLAMARDLEVVLLGEALSEASRRQLESWMADDKVGDKRLRAGAPASWRIGDKTGSGDNGTANTIAILRPPGRAPLLAAVYYTESSAPMDARNAVHREVGAIIGDAFGG